jgi:hypothetical protein
MTPEQREAALRLADEFDSQKALRTAHAWPYDVVALLRELAAEPVQEPVAWLVMSEIGPVYAAAWRQGAHDHINDALMCDDISDLDELKSWCVVPVYSHPPQRQPLTEGRLMGVYMDFDRSANKAWTSAEYLLHFARAIERAHGIGEQK